MVARRLAARRGGSATFARAFEARDRLTRRERHQASALYYLTVQRDYQRAAAEYEALLEIEPDNRAALNNVGIIYIRMRDFDRAEQQAERFDQLCEDRGGSSGQVLFRIGACVEF